jgi:hypothetical protein
MDTMMTISDAEYEALVGELVAKQDRRAILDRELRELSDTIAGIDNSRRKLPTTPGMYWHPEENWPAYLDEGGRWRDGWGSDMEEVAGDMDLEHVKRVEFVDG